MARVSYAFPLKYNPPAMRVRDVSYTKNHLSVIIEVFRPLLKKGKVILMAKQTNSLAHTKWMCKYHIDIVNIGLHFFLKNVRPYAASCSEA